jgi:hypothetical protein
MLASSGNIKVSAEEEARRIFETIQLAKRPRPIIQEGASHAHSVIKASFN